MLVVEVGVFLIQYHHFAVGLAEFAAEAEAQILQEFDFNSGMG